MKKNIFGIISIAFMISAPTAFAAQSHLTSGARLSIETRASGDIYRDGSGEESAIRQNTQAVGAAPGEEASSSGKMHDLLLVAQAHRSAVNSSVELLLAIAERDQGIGAQIRTIVEEQRRSEATTTDAIERISFRSALKSILFGKDHKNLDVLRSSLAATKNNLDQLEALLGSTADAADRATIRAQIEILQEDQENIRDFVAANNTIVLSLFGWLAEIFVPSATP